MTEKRMIKKKKFLKHSGVHITRRSKIVPRSVLFVKTVDREKYNPTALLRLRGTWGQYNRTGTIVSVELQLIRHR